MSSTRVLIADDHPVVLFGFCSALKSHGYEIVDSLEVPDHIADRYFELKPDVVILDIQFGHKKTGLDIAKDILEKDANAKIICLSMIEDVVLIQKTYRIGCSAYIFKSCKPEELDFSIKAVLKNGTYYSPEVAQMLADFAVNVRSPEEILDTREFEVFKRVAKGMTASEIGEDLHISVRTVSDSTAAVKRKLALSKPVDFTMLAMAFGVIQNPTIGSPKG